MGRWFVVCGILSSSVFADNIFIYCGKGKNAEEEKRQFSYVAETLNPESREEWSFTLYGKPVSETATLTITSGDYNFPTKYEILELDEKGNPDRRYTFNKIERCLDGRSIDLKITTLRKGTTVADQSYTCACGID